MQVIPSDNKILVIDDEEAILDLLVELFAQEGYQTKKTHSAKEGLEIVKTWQPDLIITDIQMPDMDGHSFLERLRLSLRWSDIPVIVITAFPGAGNVAEATLSGCNLLIAKPFDDKDILAQVASCLSTLSVDDVNSIVQNLGPSNPKLFKDARLKPFDGEYEAFSTEMDEIEYCVLIPMHLNADEMLFLGAEEVAAKVIIYKKMGEHWQRLWPRPRIALDKFADSDVDAA